MKRGISILVIFLILNSALIFAFDLHAFLEITGAEIKEGEDEKVLIESCKFKSSGPEVVLQKTQSVEVFIWLYESGKERFGELKLATDIEKTRENKYVFKTNENSQIYSVEAIIPDFCTRPNEELTKVINTKTNNQKEICGPPQTPRSLFMEREGYVCLYDIPSTEIQPEQAIVPAWPDQICSSEYCVTIADTMSSTNPTTNTETSNTDSNIDAQSQQALGNIIKLFFDLIFKLISQIWNVIINIFTAQPTQTPPLNPPISTSSTTSSTSSTTEEKCNIEGKFSGSVDSQNIHILIKVILLSNVNTDIKNTKELNIEVKKQDDKALCGIPSKATYYVNLQGPVLEYFGKTVLVSNLREANLLEIKETNSKLYDNVVTKGVMGNGGVLIKMNREKENYNYKDKRYDNPIYTLVELKRTFYDFIKSKEGQMNLGDWQNYNFYITFELNQDKTVTATVSEELSDNKGKTYIKKGDTQKVISGISIEDYKEYIKSLISLIRSANDVMVFEGDISSKQGGYVVINGGGPKIKKVINTIKVGKPVPQAGGVSETETTIKEEKVEKKELNDYLDLTK